MADVKNVSGAVTVTERPDQSPITPYDALAAIPKKWAHPPAETLGKLPKPYKSESPKGDCKECGKYHGLPAMHLDFMGHADLTMALIEIDPLWTWEPGAVDPETGGPMVTQQGKRYVMWAKMTLLGKTLPGVGTCEVTKPEPEKELIGDFLRNAAMRFGVATMLWSKAEQADPTGSDATGGYERRPSNARPAASPTTAAGATFRTREEAQIREMVDALEGEAQANFKAAFKEQFGESLTKLDKARHVEALSWTKFTLEVE